MNKILEDAWDKLNRFGTLQKDVNNSARQDIPTARLIMKHGFPGAFCANLLLPEYEK